VQICFNVVAKVNDGASNAFVSVPGLVTIALPDVSFEKKEDKAFSVSAIKKFVPGLGEYSDVTFTLDYTDEQHARFRALAGKNCQVKIYPPDPDGSGAELAEFATLTCFVSKVGGMKMERGTEMRFENTVVVNDVAYAEAPNNSPVGV
jgi:hypothetical protein